MLTSIFLSKISIRKGTIFSADFPALLFWPENARSRRILPASCFRLIFSRFLKLFLAKEREFFLARFFATFLWFLSICDNFGRGNALDCLDLRSFVACPLIPHASKQSQNAIGTNRP